jgi:signal transduction histidine kinase
MATMLLRAKPEEQWWRIRKDGTFVANMSHEIRNPLGAILGFSELFKSPELDEKERGFGQNNN